MEREQLVQLSLKRLKELEPQLARQWAGPEGTNTRHFYIDDFFPTEIVETAYEAFPKDGTGFESRASFREKKKTSVNLADRAPILGEITYALQDERIVAAIGQLVGFKALQPDPALARGGLSMMFRGDHVNPHIDNSHDMSRQRYRRLNILYYVSPQWSLENGGNFELWDDDRKIPKTIVAAQNRLLVMETNSRSWHSVSCVLVDRPRCCISNYYYSKESPDASDYYHVSSFAARPEQSLNKVLTKVDNLLRNFVSKTLKKARG